MKKKYFILFLFITTMLQAQHYPGLNWKIINTEHFNIIFDSRIEEDAIRVASTIEELYKPLINDMDVSVERYDIILTSEQTVSNGYVSPIGNKSVFFPVPPQDYLSGSSNWYDFLSVHEYRHIVQQSKIRKSFTGRVKHILFGDYGFAIPFPQNLPFFFYEGDAVSSETLLSKGGRGRLPAFERGIRTILLSDKDYSYSKYLFGSKRSFTPNHYVYGYYLMTYLKREYGEDVISRIADFASNYPLPLNFSVACYFITGKTMPQIYKDTMYELKYLWKEQDDLITPTNTVVLNSKKKSVYTNYIRPVELLNSRVAAIKTGLNHLSTLTIIEQNGEEKELFSIRGSIDSFKNKIMYTKKSSDFRWLYREFNDIYIYDIDSEENVKLTSKGRYFSPSFSTAGDKIAAIKHSTENQSSIIILDSLTGDILQEITDNGYDISTPVWNNEDNQIAAFFTGHGGKYLGLIDLLTGDITKLINDDFIDRTHPTFYKNYLLFRSAYSGVDNINAIHLDTKEEFRVFSSRFGSDYPLIINDKLYFSNYTFKGYRLESLDITPENWQNIKDINERGLNYSQKIIDDVDIKPIDFDNIKINNYAVNDYAGVKRTLDIHSWYINPFIPLISNNYIYNLKKDGLFNLFETVIISTNKLETLQLQLYNHFNKRSLRGDIGVQGVYTGLYPIFNFDSKLLADLSNDSFKLDYYDLNLSLTLPLNIISDFSGHGFYIGVNPLLSYNVSENKINELKSGYFFRYQFNKFDTNKRFLGLDFSNDTTLSFYHDLVQSNDKNLQLKSETISRGLFSSDNFRLKQNHFWDLSNTAQTKDHSPFNSGINFEFYNYDSNLSSQFRLDYILPILYPDLSVFNWLYYSEITLEAGYESQLEWNKNYYQAVEFTGSIYYRILRFDLFDFYSNISFNYSFESEMWDYMIIPIAINLSLSEF